MIEAWMLRLAMAVVLPVVIGAAVGALIIPAIGFIFGKSAGLEVLARIQWTIAQLATSHGSVLDERGDDSFEVHAVAVDEDGDRYHVRDGEPEYLTEDTRWTRFGKQPFSLTWDRTRERLRDQLRGTPDDPLTDGGLGSREQNGHPEWVPTWDTPGWVVDIHPYTQALHGAGGSENIETAKQDAKAEYGGDDSLTNKELILGVAGLFFGGLIIGFLMFGL